MRLYDAMPYFALEGMATVKNMPPAGCHLSCHTVGALLALFKGGGILAEDLKKRWPAVFQKNDKVYCLPEHTRKNLQGPVYQKERVVSYIYVNR
jgi:hypothetical protein